jgi:hypothetical protein
VSLSGLPFTVVAGGGWAEFTVVVANRGDFTIKSAEPSVSVQLYDGRASDFVLQFKDPSSGQWAGVPISSELGTPFTSLEVAPGTTTPVTMRISAAAAATGGSGFIMDTGTWDNGDGTCGNSDGDQGDFTVKAASASPTASVSPSASPTSSASASASASASESASAGASAEPSSSGEDGTEPQLADTGAPALLPGAALIGGAAVMAGAGAMAAVRRRRSAR